MFTPGFPGLNNAWLIEDWFKEPLHTHNRYTYINKLYTSRPQTLGWERTGWKRMKSGLEDWKVDWKVGWQESKEGRKKEMTMMATETAWDTGCF